MIVATSGSSYINYNRIISSSTSPYSVSERKTFRDPASSTTRRLYALFIVGQNNAFSLIYDDPYTDLATIDFLSPSISYKRAFPPIRNLKSAIITSPEIYYAASGYTNFHKDSTTQNYLLFSKYQSIVYSSDMTLTSCYSMAPIATTTPITMTILTTIASVS